jgi:dihydrofolate reductase
MGKIIFYVANSLDGFLADQNGGVDWLTPYQEAGYDYGYHEFYEKIGYIITGSKTFEQARNFPGGWAFPHAKTYIFSSRQLGLEGRDDLELWSGSIPELGNLLRAEEKDTWLLGGANLAGQFFNAGLVDELVLSIMPTILGKGLPLFEGIEKPLDADLIKNSAYPNGVIQLVYTI